MIILHTMKPPIYVRPLSDAERKTLEAGLRSPDAFTLRRCQILLASADGQNAYQIAHNLGCNPQTARNAIHKVNQEGLQEALRRGSNRPHTVNRSFDEEGAEALRQMLHRSPREFGKPSSLWTMEMAAEVSFEEGLTKEPVSGETVRATLARMGVRWQRAKHWITSPDPLYERKKAARPTDAPGGGQARLGGRLRGRVLVEQSEAAELVQLRPSRRALAPRGAVGREGRSRPEGHLLLRALHARTRTQLAQVRGRSSAERHDHALFAVVLPEAGGHGQEGVGVDLGQRKLAHKPPGQTVDRISQPGSEKGRDRRRGKDHRLSVAQEEPVAQCDGAQVD